MEFLQDLSLQELRAIIRILKKDLTEHFKDYQKLSKEELIQKILEKYDVDHDKLNQKGLIDFSSIFVKREEKAKKKVEAKERAKAKAIERRHKKKSEKVEKVEKEKEHEMPVKEQPEHISSNKSKEMEHLSGENKTISEAKQITDDIHDKLTEMDENAKEILRLTHTKEQSHEVANLIKVIDRLTADNNELRIKLESVLNENKKIEPVIKKSTSEIAVQTEDIESSSSSSESEEEEPEPIKHKKEKRKEFEEVKEEKKKKEDEEPVMPILPKLKNNINSLPDSYEPTKSNIANKFLDVVFDLINILKNPKSYDIAKQMLRISLGGDVEDSNNFVSEHYNNLADNFYQFYESYNNMIPKNPKVVENVWKAITRILKSVKREDITDEKLGDIIGDVLLKLNSHRRFTDYIPSNNQGYLFARYFWDNIVDEILGYYSKMK